MAHNAAIIKPRNADPSLQDSVTGKAAVEAVRMLNGPVGACRQIVIGFPVPALLHPAEARFCHVGLVANYYAL